MKSVSSDDNLTSLEKFRSSSINQENHIQNAQTNLQPNDQPLLVVFDHSDANASVHDYFTEQIHSTNEAANEDTAPVEPIQSNPIPAFEELKLSESNSPQNTAE
jgi:hypothetical protein